MCVSSEMKVASRVALIRKLAGTTWGADAATLRVSVLALVFSTAEYCAQCGAAVPTLICWTLN